MAIKSNSELDSKGRIRFDTASMNEYLGAIADIVKIPETNIVTDDASYWVEDHKIQLAKIIFDYQANLDLIDRIKESTDVILKVLAGIIDEEDIDKLLEMDTTKLEDVEELENSFLRDLLVTKKWEDGKLVNISGSDDISRAIRELVLRSDYAARKTDINYEAVQSGKSAPANPNKEIKRTYPNLYKAMRKSEDDVTHQILNLDPTDKDDGKPNTVKG